MSGFDNEVLYSIGERLEPSSQQAIGLMQKGSSDVSRVNTIGSPEGVVSANPASLDHDPSTGQVYIKRSGVGNTGWSQILTSTTGVLPVPNGGTGKSTFVPFSVVAGGTTTTTPLQQVSGVGTSGQLLTSNGAGLLPTWQAAPSGGITTINGNSGSATGSTVTISTITNSGTSTFIASGSSSTLQFHDAGLNVVIGYGILAPVGSNNTGLGYTVFNTGITGSSNTAVGKSASQNLTSGANNSAFGVGAIQNVDTGQQNTAIGGGNAGGSITTGSFNTFLGYNAGTSYTTSDSSNICINSVGSSGESNTTRIGVQGSGDFQQDTCFIAGITGATANGNSVICSSTGQLATSGVATNSGQPSFSVYVGSGLSNVTGDGTAYTIPFDTALVNRGSYYNTSNGVFTAPVTGVYYFCAAIQFSGIVVQSNAFLNILASGVSYVCDLGNPISKIVSGQMGLVAHCVAPMTANDTAICQVTFSGSTKTVNISTGGNSVFGGYLIG